MAHTKFYFDKNEWQELFEYLQRTESKLIPDIFYEEQKSHIISNFDEFIKCQKQETTHFFLINEAFTLEPLMVDLNEYTKEPKYKVRQRKGGPYIDISYYRGFAEDAIIPYKATSIQYYPNFIHFDSYNEFKASNELKEYYLNLVKFIKKRCKIVSKNNMKYLIGYGVFKEIEACINPVVK